MLLLLVDVKRKEYAIKMMCGATKSGIIVEMAMPIVAAIVLANVISVVVLGQLQLLFLLILCSLILAAVILSGPGLKLFKMSLTEAINK